MQRVVIVGPGAAGKSTLAARLGAITGIAVIELDQCFWRPGLVPTPRGQWSAMQRELVRRPAWIMDGDLGPYDVAEVRFEAADTIVFLDFRRARCLWRAVRRSRENTDFWRWLWAYRCRSRPGAPARGRGQDRRAVQRPGDAALHSVPRPYGSADARGTAEVGYGLHPAYRGHGHALRALRLVLDHAFGEDGIEIMHWRAVVGNWASRKTAWRCGFRIEGTVRGLCPQPGRAQDGWIASLHRDDPRRPCEPWPDGGAG